MGMFEDLLNQQLENQAQQKASDITNKQTANAIDNYTTNIKKEQQPTSPLDYYLNLNQQKEIKQKQIQNEADKQKGLANINKQEADDLALIEAKKAQNDSIIRNQSDYLNRLQEYQSNPFKTQSLEEINSITNPTEYINKTNKENALINNQYNTQLAINQAKQDYTNQKINFNTQKSIQQLEQEQALALNRYQNAINAMQKGYILSENQLSNLTYTGLKASYDLATTNFLDAQTPLVADMSYKHNGLNPFSYGYNAGKYIGLGMLDMLDDVTMGNASKALENAIGHHLSTRSQVDNLGYFSTLDKISLDLIVGSLFRSIPEMVSIGGTSSILARGLGTLTRSDRLLTGAIENVNKLIKAEKITQTDGEILINNIRNYGASNLIIPKSKVVEMLGEYSNYANQIFSKRFIDWKSLAIGGGLFGGDYLRRVASLVNSRGDNANWTINDFLYAIPHIAVDYIGNAVMLKQLQEIKNELKGIVNPTIESSGKYKLLKSITEGSSIETMGETIQTYLELQAQSNYTLPNLTTLLFSNGDQYRQERNALTESMIVAGALGGITEGTMDIYDRVREKRQNRLNNKLQQSMTNQEGIGKDNISNPETKDNYFDENQDIKDFYNNISSEEYKKDKFTNFSNEIKNDFKTLFPEEIQETDENGNKIDFDANNSNIAELGNIAKRNLTNEKDETRKEQMNQFLNKVNKYFTMNEILETSEAINSLKNSIDNNQNEHFNSLSSEEKTKLKHELDKFKGSFKDNKIDINNSSADEIKSKFKEFISNIRNKNLKNFILKELNKHLNPESENISSTSNNNNNEDITFSQKSNNKQKVSSNIFHQTYSDKTELNPEENIENKNIQENKETDIDTKQQEQIKENEEYNKELDKEINKENIDKTNKNENNENINENNEDETIEELPNINTNVIEHLNTLQKAKELINNYKDTDYKNFISNLDTDTIKALIYASDEKSKYHNYIKNNMVLVNTSDLKGSLIKPNREININTNRNNKNFSVLNNFRYINKEIKTKNGTLYIKDNNDFNNRINIINSAREKYTILNAKLNELLGLNYTNLNDDVINNKLKNIQFHFNELLDILKTNYETLSILSQIENKDISDRARSLVTDITNELSNLNEIISKINNDTKLNEIQSLNKSSPFIYIKNFINQQINNINSNDKSSADTKKSFINKLTTFIKGIVNKLKEIFSDKRLKEILDLYSSLNEQNIKNEVTNNTTSYNDIKFANELGNEVIIKMGQNSRINLMKLMPLLHTFDISNNDSLLKAWNDIIEVLGNKEINVIQKSTFNPLLKFFDKYSFNNNISIQFNENEQAKNYEIPIKYSWLINKDYRDIINSNDFMFSDLMQDILKHISNNPKNIIKINGLTINSIISKDNIELNKETGKYLLTENINNENSKKLFNKLIPNFKDINNPNNLSGSTTYNSFQTATLQALNELEPLISAGAISILSILGRGNKSTEDELNNNLNSININNNKISDNGINQQVIPKILDILAKNKDDINDNLTQEQLSFLNSILGLSRQLLANVEFKINTVDRNTGENNIKPYKYFIPMSIKNENNINKIEYNIPKSLKQFLRDNITDKITEVIKPDSLYKGILQGEFKKQLNKQYLSLRFDNKLVKDTLQKTLGLNKDFIDHLEETTLSKEAYNLMFKDIKNNTEEFKKDLENNKLPKVFKYIPVVLNTKEGDKIKIFKINDELANNENFVKNYFTNVLELNFLDEKEKEQNIKELTNKIDSNQVNSTLSTTYGVIKEFGALVYAYGNAIKNPMFELSNSSFDLFEPITFELQQQSNSRYYTTNNYLSPQSNKFLRMAYNYNKGTKTYQDLNSKTLKTANNKIYKNPSYYKDKLNAYTIAFGQIFGFEPKKGIIDTTDNNNPTITYELTDNKGKTYNLREVIENIITNPNNNKNLWNELKQYTINNIREDHSLLANKNIKIIDDYINTGHFDTNNFIAYLDGSATGFVQSAFNTNIGNNFNSIVKVTDNPQELNELLKRQQDDIYEATIKSIKNTSSKFNNNTNLITHILSTNLLTRDLVKKIDTPIGYGSSLINVFRFESDFSKNMLNTIKSELSSIINNLSKTDEFKNTINNDEKIKLIFDELQKRNINKEKNVYSILEKILRDIYAVKQNDGNYKIKNNIDDLLLKNDEIDFNTINERINNYYNEQLKTFSWYIENFSEINDKDTMNKLTTENIKVMQNIINKNNKSFNNLNDIKQALNLINSELINKDKYINVIKLPTDKEFNEKLNKFIDNLNTNKNKDNIFKKLNYQVTETNKENIKNGIKLLREIYLNTKDKDNNIDGIVLKDNNTTLNYMFKDIIHLIEAQKLRTQIFNKYADNIYKDIDRIAIKKFQDYLTKIYPNKDVLKNADLYLKHKDKMAEIFAGTFNDYINNLAVDTIKDINNILIMQPYNIQKRNELKPKLAKEFQNIFNKEINTSDTIKDMIKNGFLQNQSFSYLNNNTISNSNQTNYTSGIMSVTPLINHHSESVGIQNIKKICENELIQIFDAFIPSVDNLEQATNIWDKNPTNAQIDISYSKYYDELNKKIENTRNNFLNKIDNQILKDNLNTDFINNPTESNDLKVLKLFTHMMYSQYKALSTLNSKVPKDTNKLFNDFNKIDNNIKNNYLKILKDYFNQVDKIQKQNNETYLIKNPTDNSYFKSPIDYKDNIKDFIERLNNNINNKDKFNKIVEELQNFFYGKDFNDVLTINENNSNNTTKSTAIMTNNEVVDKQNKEFNNINNLNKAFDYIRKYKNDETLNSFNKFMNLTNKLEKNTKIINSSNIITSINNINKLDGYNDFNLPNVIDYLSSNLTNILNNNNKENKHLNKLKDIDKNISDLTSLEKEFKLLFNEKTIDPKTLKNEILLKYFNNKNIKNLMNKYLNQEISLIPTDINKSKVNLTIKEIINKYSKQDNRKGNFIIKIGDNPFINPFLLHNEDNTESVALVQQNNFNELFDDNSNNTINPTNSKEISFNQKDNSINSDEINSIEDIEKAINNVQTLTQNASNNLKKKGLIQIANLIDYISNNLVKNTQIVYNNSKNSAKGRTTFNKLKVNNLDDVSNLRNPEENDKAYIEIFNNKDEATEAHEIIHSAIFYASLNPNVKARQIWYELGQIYSKVKDLTKSMSDSELKDKLGFTRNDYNYIFNNKELNRGIHEFIATFLTEEKAFNFINQFNFDKNEFNTSNTSLLQKGMSLARKLLTKIYHILSLSFLTNTLNNKEMGNELINLTKKLSDFNTKENEIKRLEKEEQFILNRMNKTSKEVFLYATKGIFLNAENYAKYHNLDIDETKKLFTEDLKDIFLNKERQILAIHQYAKDKPFYIKLPLVAIGLLNLLLSTPKVLVNPIKRNMYFQALNSAKNKLIENTIFDTIFQLDFKLTKDKFLKKASEMIRKIHNHNSFLNVQTEQMGRATKELINKYIEEQPYLKKYLYTLPEDNRKKFKEALGVLIFQLKIGDYGLTESGQSSNINKIKEAINLFRNKSDLLNTKIDNLFTENEENPNLQNITSLAKFAIQNSISKDKRLPKDKENEFIKNFFLNATQQLAFTRISRMIGKNGFTNVENIWYAFCLAYNKEINNINTNNLNFRINDTNYRNSNRMVNLLKQLTTLQTIKALRDKNNYSAYIENKLLPISKIFSDTRLNPNIANDTLKTLEFFSQIYNDEMRSSRIIKRINVKKAKELRENNQNIFSPKNRDLLYEDYNQYNLNNLDALSDSSDVIEIPYYLDSYIPFDFNNEVDLKKINKPDRRNPNDIERYNNEIKQYEDKGYEIIDNISNNYTLARYKGLINYRDNSNRIGYIYNSSKASGSVKYGDYKEELDIINSYANDYNILGKLYNEKINLDDYKNKNNKRLVMSNLATRDRMDIETFDKLIEPDYSIDTLFYNLAKENFLAKKREINNDLVWNEVLENNKDIQNREFLFNKYSTNFARTRVTKHFQPHHSIRIARVINKDGSYRIVWEKDNLEKYNIRVGRQDLYALDRIIRARGESLAEYAKKSKDKQGGIYIDNRLLSMYFGYKTHLLPTTNNGKLDKLLKGIQTFLRFFVRESRNNTIIRNPSLVIKNYTSNMLGLVAMGIPPNQVFNSQITYIKALEDYINDTKEYNQKYKELEILYSYTRSSNYNQNEILPKIRKLQQEVNELKNKLNSNLIKPLFDEGLYTNIVEDSEEESYHIDQALIDKIKKTFNLTSEKEEYLIQELALTSKSDLYNVLARWNRYGDIIPRAILYYYDRGNGKSHQEAINHAQDVFINYNSPLFSPVLRNLDYYGFTNYLKYRINVQGQILKIIKDKPINAMLYFLANNTLRLDYASSFLSENILMRGLPTGFLNPVSSTFTNIFRWHNMTTF